MGGLLDGSHKKTKQTRKEAVAILSTEKASQEPPTKRQISNETPKTPSNKRQKKPTKTPKTVTKRNF